MHIYLPKRKFVRLQGYDYGQGGGYFVTICSHGRKHLFGNVINGSMRPNERGQIATDCWLGLPEHYPNVELDDFIVMPNHLHGIIVIIGDQLVRARHASPLLGRLVGSFKSAAARRINQCSDSDDSPVWQRNYYEHVIRSEQALNRIREYIRNNPQEWSSDRENRDRSATDEFERWLQSEGSKPLPAGSPSSRSGGHV